MALLSWGSPETEDDSVRLPPGGTENHQSSSNHRVVEAAADLASEADTSSPSLLSLPPMTTVQAEEVDVANESHVHKINGIEDHQEQEEFLALSDWDEVDEDDWNEVEAEQDYDSPQSTRTDDRMGNQYENGAMHEGDSSAQFDACSEEPDAQEPSPMESPRYQKHTHQQEVNESDLLNHPLGSAPASAYEEEVIELEHHHRSDAHSPTELPQHDAMHEASNETTKISYSYSQSRSRSLMVHVEEPSPSPEKYHHPQHHPKFTPVPVETISSTDMVAVPEFSQELMMTPSPACNSNFFFLSDEKSVPEEHNRVQDKAVQRRREFQKSIHDLQYRVASLTANVAEESMDREKSMEQVKDTCIDGPTEEMVERIALQQEAYQSQDYARVSDASNDESSTCTTNSRVLERRLSTLDSKMTHSVHVQIQDSKRQQLGSLSAVLENEIAKDFKLEATKADKREGSLVRRFESLVGTLVRRHQEERATRVAALQVATDKMRDELTDPFLDPARASAAVVLLGELRTQLEQVRAERQEQDERVLELIVHRTATMKRALLAASDSGGDF
jgi:hypothetical protein